MPSFSECGSRYLAKLQFVKVVEIGDHLGLLIFVQFKQIPIREHIQVVPDFPIDHYPTRPSY